LAIVNKYDLRCLNCCIRPYLDSKTAGTIAASNVHSKLDYCNSLYYNLPKSQINRLQQIQNCLARTVVKAPKSSHITPILRSLHWLNITERIEYKLLSLTYKVLTTSQPTQPDLCSVYTQNPLLIHCYRSQALTLPNAAVQFSTAVKDLGFVLDSQLVMANHVAALSRSCFFYARQLKSIKQSLTPEALKTLVYAFISALELTTAVTVRSQASEVNCFRGCKPSRTLLPVSSLGPARRSRHDTDTASTALAANTSTYSLQDGRVDV